MADYAPIFKPGVAGPRTASADITAGRLVEVSGTDSVAHAAAASTKFVGVASFDCKSGDRITVQCGGVQRLLTSGAVTAGDQLVAAAGGTVVASASPAAGTVVAIAQTSAASGALVEGQMTR